MSKFIQLTNVVGREFYLNVSHIEQVCSALPYEDSEGLMVPVGSDVHKDAKGLIFMNGSDMPGAYYEAKESMHEIMRRISMAK